MQYLEAALEDNGLLWSEIPREALSLAGKAFMKYRRSGGPRSAPLSDLLIAAHPDSLSYRATFVSGAALRQGLGARGLDSGSSFRGSAPNLERTTGRHGPFVVEDPRD